MPAVLFWRKRAILHGQDEATNAHWKGSKGSSFKSQLNFDRRRSGLPVLDLYPIGLKGLLPLDRFSLDQTRVVNEDSYDPRSTFRALS